MTTLALDTSTPHGSVALRRDGALLVARAGDGSRPHGVRLPAEVLDTLADPALTLGEITLLAVGLGPGAFTGLRVGLATIQGLSFATGIPVAGVSGFDALAVSASRSVGTREVAVVLDAARGEVFAARFVRDAETFSGLRLIDDPRAAPLTDVLDEWATTGALPETWIGDAAVINRDAIERVVAAAQILPSPLLAPLVAELGEALAARGETSPLHALAPLYVRRPDAELARQRAHAGGAG